MDIYDIVVVGNKVFRISGIYLSETGGQNIVGLQNLNGNNGSANGVALQEMLVPEELIFDDLVYTAPVNRAGREKL